MAGQAVSAENPTYTLTDVKKAGKEGRVRERNCTSLHLYEHMSVNNQTETGEQEVDSAGYTTVQSQRSCVGVGVSPTCTTELLPQDNTSYMVMNRQRKPDEAESQVCEEQRGTTAGEGKSTYANIDDTQFD